MINRQEELKRRFLRYAAVTSQSDAAAGTVPSSPGQRELAELLAADLKELGLQDVSVDEHAVVYGTLPANAEAPVIGFLAHLDTVDVSLSPEVHPQLIHYEGGDVILNAEKGIVLRAEDHPELARYVGDDILFSDGTSVLGADNKAAVANIMTMLTILQDDSSIPHGELQIAFVPDEEIGLCGSKVMDLERFKVDFAYTIDCCELGEVVYETFNAGSVSIRIRGVTAHPMSAKGVLVNPLLVAHDFIAMFDRTQTPECTDGKDGYWWFSGITADALNCSLSMMIRDHDLASYEARKKTVEEKIAALKAMHPRADIECVISDTYGNIANHVSREDEPVDMIFRACEALGIDAKAYAMRGGTDGSALAARGVVTPNYFTGAHNFHSYAEFLPMGSFEKSLLVTLKLIELSLGK